MASDSQGGDSCQLLCLGDIHQSALRRLWSLEAVGMKEVTLPWKENATDQLQDNKASAERRLSGLMRKLKKDPKLHAAYDDALQAMESAGQWKRYQRRRSVALIPSSTYHLIDLPSSTTTKVRPVFDASACGPNGASLNDCLEIGPCLIPNLVEALIRFRRWKVGVTADFSKAFLQIGVRREDRDCHRFLWSREGRTRM